MAPVEASVEERSTFHASGSRDLIVGIISMPPPLRLNAAAFISPQNHPILVRNFTSATGTQDDLKYHYVAHTSLDVIEERRATGHF